MKSQGQILKEQGQQLALFNAGKWTDLVIERLRDFCAERKAMNAPEFKIEDFRERLELSGGPLPHHSNAWGALPSIAVRQKLIRSTGRYEKAKSDRTHAHPVAIWIAQ